MSLGCSFLFYKWSHSISGIIGSTQCNNISAEFTKVFDAQEELKSYWLLYQDYYLNPQHLEKCLVWYMWMKAKLSKGRPSNTFFFFFALGLIYAFFLCLWMPLWYYIHLAAQFPTAPHFPRKESPCSAPWRGCYCDGWLCWNCRALTHANLIHHRAIRTGTLVMYYVSASSERCHLGDGFINTWDCHKTEENRV